MTPSNVMPCRCHVAASLPKQQADLYMRAEGLARAIEYKGWVLRVRVDRLRGDAIFLQWTFLAPCSKTKRESVQTGRKWYLSPHMTDSEIVCTAFKAALTAEEHECREAFRFNDRRIFNPHIDIKALWTVCEIEDVRS
ncbi:MAG TPA: hypothetical protein VFS24_06270 [Steroidobacteraceae bacterium]|nr:hypothetical protein [Steroidobacteraceae bacterium]